MVSLSVANRYEIFFSSLDVEIFIDYNLVGQLTMYIICRAPGMEFLGKRAPGMEFLGKRWTKANFFGNLGNF